MIGLLALGFIGVFWRWFEAQNRHSVEALQDWGHAYVIPIISGYLVYKRWPAICRAEVMTFWPGLVPMMAGVAAYMFFLMGFPNHMGQGAAMILTLFGMVLLVCGPRVMRHTFLPIMYLVFAVTVSERIMLEVTFKLQNVAAHGGWFLLSIFGPIFGYTAVLTGNGIEMIREKGETIPLGIAEACSGMRMVVAFIALAGAVALTSCRWWWQRVAVVLLATPVAVLMNVVRVAVLGLVSLKDPKLAQGDAHIFIGTVLLLPGLALFMTAVWSLDRIWVTEPEKKPSKAAVDERPIRLGAGWSALRSGAFVATLVVLATFSLGMSSLIDKMNIHTRKLPIYPKDGRLLSAIGPDVFPRWIAVGPDHRESEEVEKTLGTSNYLTRTYVRRERGATSHLLQLHAAYYTGKIDTVPHVPERCMVGGGFAIEAGPWRIKLPLDQSRWWFDPRDPDSKALGYRKARLSDRSDSPGSSVTMPRDIETAEMQITQFVSPDGKRMYAGYFFIANGTVATTAEQVRLKAFDLTADYACYLKIQVSTDSVVSPQELAQEAASLLDDALPELMRCVPDWIDVQRGEYPQDNPRRKPAPG
ncbi:MAG: exosortase/archaeosortase family protein [Planctomycetota bacterium]